MFVAVSITFKVIKSIIIAYRDNLFFRIKFFHLIRERFIQIIKYIFNSHNIE